MARTRRIGIEDGPADIAGIFQVVHLQFFVVGCMTLAMGVENAAFERDGGVVVGLTYITGTLVKFGQKLANAVLGGERFGWAPHVALWLGLVSGGIAGAISDASHWP